MGQIKQLVILMNVKACFVSVREALGIVRLIKEKKKTSSFMLIMNL